MDKTLLREFITLAEDMQFSTEQSARLAPLLLGFAETARRKTDRVYDSAIVNSAIRTGASMLCPNRAHLLLPFLGQGYYVDTTNVALKMLGRIFEAQPPEWPDQHTDIAERIWAETEKQMWRYRMLPPIRDAHCDAHVQLAIYALAAMASEKVLGIVRIVRQAGISWFVEQALLDLSRLRDHWHKITSPPQRAVFEVLENAMLEIARPKDDSAKS